MGIHLLEGTTLILVDYSRVNIMTQFRRQAETEDSVDSNVFPF